MKHLYGEAAPEAPSYLAAVHANAAANAAAAAAAAATMGALWGGKEIEAFAAP